MTHRYIHVQLRADPDLMQCSLAMWINEEEKQKNLKKEREGERDIL